MAMPRRTAHNLRELNNREVFESGLSSTYSTTWPHMMHTTAETVIGNPAGDTRLVTEHEQGCDGRSEDGCVRHSACLLSPRLRSAALVFAARPTSVPVRYVRFRRLRQKPLRNEPARTLAASLGRANPLAEGNL